MKTHAPLFTPVLIAGCIIIMLGFSIRASFGVFQIPIAEDFGCRRAEFSMAIAIQNLFWGIGQPIFGALAEKIGDRKAIFLGAVLYAAGLTLSSFATTPLAMQSLEVLVGLGVAGTGLGVILAIVARSASDENRSMSLAIATAAGSLGQVIGAPTAEWLLSMMPWQGVFLVFAAAIASVVLALPFLGKPAMSTTELDEKMGVVVGRAFRDPSFAMIFIGFFSCGYQLGFIVAHFPGLVTENEACISTARVIRADCGELYLRVKNGDRIYSEVYPGDFHLDESQQLQIGYEAADDPQGNTCMQAAGVAFARVICIRKEL